MKYLLFFLILTSCISPNSDKKNSKNLETDTVFIDRKNYPDLFIEPIPENRFSFINEWGDPGSCLQNEQNGFPSKWLEITQLNGEYYFYLWFGPGGINKLIFCGNEFYSVMASGDHLEPTRIIDFIKKSDKEFSYIVSYKDLESGSMHVIDRKREITFYIIDEKNKIAIVEDSYRTNKYYLAIAQEKKYDIPILVHQNFRNGLHTYVAWPFEDFDKIDYEQILKEKGFKLESD